MANVSVVVQINEGSVHGLLSGDDAQKQMDTGAEAARKMQLLLVPVDTGNLSRNIEIRKTPDGLGRMVGVWVVKYAAAVENGHQTKAGTWVPAQPFVRPSMDAVRRSLR